MKRRTGFQNITFVQANVAMMADVQRLAEQVALRFDRLDELINNLLPACSKK